MPISRMGSKLLLHAALIGGAIAATACGGVTQFQGQTALNVTGTPPAPPPPPPAPEPPPPPPPSRVEVKSDKIEIKDKIQFEVNKATILPQSFALMDELSDVIKKNPHIKKISIEGHASSEGDAAKNVKLSDERAKAVMKYIVDKGIEATRLSAKGFGAKKPIADNATEEGREKNRRVEFVITEQDVTQKKVEVDASGKEKVLEEKKSTEKKEEPVAPADGAAATKLPAPAPKKPAAEKK